ncbi:MAG TPA: acyl-ACP thioesterase domain-containing protein [Polyangiaceae bacterium]
MAAALEVFSNCFDIHDFDSDAFGSLTMPRLLGYLLHAAGGSADSLGFGIRELQKQGLTWVIGRIRIVLNECLAVGDSIIVETWPSGLQRSIAMRDFRIIRNGLEVGRATSQWFVLDMETRMPVRPHAWFPERLRAQPEHLVTLSRTVPKLLEPPELCVSFEVRKADIDINRHVTAASYVTWAMESIPETVWSEQRIESFDVHFLEECHLGSTVMAESQRADEVTLLHRIRRNDANVELARLATTWVPRG